MAWETRNGGGRYYTRSKRVGGRVVREYVGTGPAAELAAEADAARRAQREQERRAWNRAKKEIEASEDALERLREAVRGLLVDGGFYRHNRGEWRRRGGRHQGDEATGCTD